MQSFWKLFVIFRTLASYFTVFIENINPDLNFVLKYYSLSYPLIFLVYLHELSVLDENF